jgi:hypothetical protein
MGMKEQGELVIDPVSLETAGRASEVEVVVPYTEWPITHAVLERAAVLAAGLNPRIVLVAVHTVPYASPDACPAAEHAHLVEELVDLASHCPVPVTPHVVLARGREEGLKFFLKKESTVLIGVRERLWRTAEERLARSLADDGYKVVLMHIG